MASVDAVSACKSMAQMSECCMAVQITIRDVPEDVRDELAARAAAQRRSMQEFLRGELEKLAARPSLDTWLREVQYRKEATDTRVGASEILQARDADRT